jgi:hypothetical protein
MIAMRMMQLSFHQVIDFVVMPRLRAASLKGMKQITKLRHSVSSIVRGIRVLGAAEPSASRRRRKEGDPEGYRPRGTV